MSVESLRLLLNPVFDAVSGASLDAELGDKLNRLFPVEGETFKSIESACHKAIAEGWMCAQGGEGRRFGRVIEPQEETAGFSVDVVDLANIVGPHHRHPSGEVCMIMPIDSTAQFDGNGRGWCVYEPGSDHYPTVTDGEALVLYLLPNGEIEFTGKA